MRKKMKEKEKKKKGKVWNRKMRVDNKEKYGIGR